MKSLFRAVPAFVGLSLAVFGGMAGGLGLAGVSPAAASTNQTAPQLAVNASGATTVGLQVFANVNLSGGNAATGTLTFWLFGASDPTCAQAPVFTSTVAVTGTSMNSARYTTATAGTYRWLVAYSGDANNAPVPPTPCANPSSAVVVSRQAPGVGVNAVPPAGDALWATARISGYDPTGTLTFYLTPPGDTFCSTPPVFTSTVAVNGDGSYTSGRYVLPVGGQYKWRVAYSGDDNNVATAVTACLDANAAVAVPAFATFTSPQANATNVDPTAAFTWTAATGATGYFVMVGTTPGGWDLAWSGQLPGSQTSYSVSALPAGPVYATLYTLVNNTWSWPQSVTFSAAGNEAGLTSPMSDQANAATTAPITWTTAAGVSGYALWVGTSYGATDVFGTGLLPPTQASLTPAALPAGQTLYIMLFTLHPDNTWTHQAITFATPGGPHNLSSSKSSSSSAPGGPPCPAGGPGC